MPENAAKALIENGTLGAMLVLAGLALLYVTKRFIDYLEKADERHLGESQRWRETLDEHTKISRDMANSIRSLDQNQREMYEHLRYLNGKGPSSQIGRS